MSKILQKQRTFGRGRKFRPRRALVPGAQYWSRTARAPGTFQAPCTGADGQVAGRFPGARPGNTGPAIPTPGMELARTDAFLWLAWDGEWGAWGACTSGRHPPRFAGNSRSVRFTGRIAAMGPEKSGGRWGRNGAPELGRIYDMLRLDMVGNRETAGSGHMAEFPRNL